jgi:uncharacterized tellurite resistance protein B-like protein
MIKSLIEQVREAISATQADAGDADRDSAIRLATAVLMVDVARADNEFDETEFQAVLDLIAERFRLSGEDAVRLANSADERAEELVSVHEFTQLLHNNLDETEKADVVRLLWEVAYADGRLDKFEDSLVLKISDLLHVNRGAVMRLKHDAASAAN